MDNSYQHTETGDVGEGCGHGGAGERELAEVADEHDGDHLKAVLEEARHDERPGQGHQTPCLRHRIAVVRKAQTAEQEIVQPTPFTI